MQPVDNPRVYSGRYEATHLVARGGMAQVYRAMDRQLDRPVALKVLFPELSVDRTFVERFRREAQAAANLSHPNIVPVFDWGEDDGAYFIVMEYIDGRPLSAVLRDPQPVPPTQIATIGAGVAAALAFAHRHGVVHRDVKPGNVLITPEGDVKVTDFGIARAVNTEESLTQTGAVMGTAAYFSPEQAEGKGVDSRSDIYSLGVVLYEMAVGRPPFTGDSPGGRGLEARARHARTAPGGQPAGAGGARGRDHEGDGQAPGRPLPVGGGAAGGPAALRRRPPGRGGGSRRHLHAGRGGGHRGRPDDDGPDDGRSRRRRPTLRQPRRSRAAEADAPPRHRPHRAPARPRGDRLLPAALGRSVATSPCPTWWGTRRASPSRRCRTTT